MDYDIDQIWKDVSELQCLNGVYDGDCSGITSDDLKSRIETLEKYVQTI